MLITLDIVTVSAPRVCVRTCALECYRRTCVPNRCILRSRKIITLVADGRCNTYPTVHIYAARRPVRRCAPRDEIRSLALARSESVGHTRAEVALVHPRIYACWSVLVRRVDPPRATAFIRI